MPKMENMGDDKSFTIILNKLVEGSMMLAKIGVAGAPDDNTPKGMTLMLAAMAGPVAGLAILTGNGERTTKEGAIFAGCLVACAFEPVHGENVKLEFSPEIICNAIEMFEQHTGKKAEDCLDRVMVKSMREFQTNASDPLNKLLAARPSPPTSEAKH